MCCNPRVCFKIPDIKVCLCCDSIISQSLPNFETQFSQKEEGGSYDNVSLNQRFYMYLSTRFLTVSLLLFSPSLLSPPPSLSLSLSLSSLSLSLSQLQFYISFRKNPCSYSQVKRVSPIQCVCFRNLLSQEEVTKIKQAVENDRFTQHAFWVICINYCLQYGLKWFMISI